MTIQSMLFVLHLGSLEVVILLLVE